MPKAAEFGLNMGRYNYGRLGFLEGCWERYYWRRQAAVGGDLAAIRDMGSSARQQLKLYERGEGSGRVVFEIGAACKGHVNVGAGIAFGVGVCPEDLRAMERAVVLHEEWCKMAKRAIWCWIWFGRQVGVVKDVRIIISNILWSGRAAWCEKSKT